MVARSILIGLALLAGAHATHTGKPAVAAMSQATVNELKAHVQSKKKVHMLAQAKTQKKAAEDPLSGSMQDPHLALANLAGAALMSCMTLLVLGCCFTQVLVAR